MDFVLEACVDSVESAMEAAAGGATRLELCGDLIVGGVTPDPVLFECAREAVDLPVRVLLRPRFGDFLYTDAEFELLRRQVRRYAAMGADGVVIGVLRADGTLDETRMAELIALAQGVGVTLHRAFDLCRYPFEALAAAKRLGVDTILTSGQRASCTEGAELLAELVRASNGTPRILIGAGVNAAAIASLGAATGTRAFHLSGKQTLESGMKYRREGVPMGLPGISEYEIWRTDRTAIRAVRQALEALDKGEI